MLLVYETTDSLSEKWQKGRIKLLEFNALYAHSCKMTLKIPRARSIDCCGERAALHVKKNTPVFKLGWIALPRLCAVLRLARNTRLAIIDASRP
jgi:hypothetical protein